MLHLTLAILLQTAAAASATQDYATAYKQLQEDGKPLVVLIGADWCPGCRTMKYSAMPEVEKQGGLKKVAFAYVNVDQQNKLAGQLMKGGSIPQLIMFHKTADGWKREQLTGAHAVDEIHSFIKRSAAAESSKLSSN